MAGNNRVRGLPDWLKTNFVIGRTAQSKPEVPKKREDIETLLEAKEGSTVNEKYKETTEMQRKRYCTRNSLMPNLKVKSVKTADIEPSSTFVDYSGKIEFHMDFHYIAYHSEQLLEWANQQTENVIPIAFDMEWPFSFTTGSGRTAVIQMCANLDTCYVFHVYNLKKLPAALFLLLSHERVCLHGVNIKNDLRKLERDFPDVKAQKMIDRCVDLGPYCNRVMNTGGRWSMERLVFCLCHKKINKDKKVRMSKWHLLPLSMEQKLYAAIDVYISQVIYQKLRERELEKEKEAKKFIEEFGLESFKQLQKLQ